MKQMAGIFLALSTAASCTEMTDYYPNAQEIDVNGRIFFVSPHPNTPGVYLAGPNDPTGAETFLGGGMALPAANVRAIETATGCQVEPATIKNTNTGTTWASVSC